MNENRYWLSWYQPTDDYRPLTDPPHPQILGWWCTGYNNQDHATICALVEAGSEQDAKVYVEVSWPESATAEWRFCERRDDWKPTDRFPLSPWMKERLEHKP